MRIALATYADLPDWEVDDRPLHEALAARDVEFEQPAWDDDHTDWSSFDACLIRTTWDYMNRCAEFLRWIERAAAQTKLYNPPGVVRWSAHKSYLRDLQQAGVPVIDTIWLDANTTGDIAPLLAERSWSRGFIKPAIGATARETLRFTNSEADLQTAQQHVDRLRAAGEDVLLQPYCASVETEGEYSTIWIDGEFSHGVRKIPQPGDYRVQDDFGATDEPWPPPPPPDEEVLDMNRAALRAAEQIHAASLDAQPLLYGRVDMLRSDTGRLCITELELVEPSLFFRHGPGAADRLADVLLQRVQTAVSP